MELSEQIRRIFYNYLDGEISLKEFEQWVYKNADQLENISAESQFELINFDYSQYDSKDKIWNYIYYSIIDKRDYTEWRLKKLLTLTLHKDTWKAAIVPLYWEFWDDNSRFKFLLPISNLIAVSILKPENIGLSDFSDIRRAKIEDEFVYPEIFFESKQLLNNINSGLIQITGEKEFKDDRINISPILSFQEILEHIQTRIKE